MQKFQSVNIIDTLQKIVNNNTLHYQTDFEYDIETFKTAAPGSHFLWLSRDSGTDLYTERDAHIRNTAAHNGWRYYSDSKYYGVRAFAVEVRDNYKDAQPAGDIYELHYNKHIEEVRRNSFNAKSATVTFKPTNGQEAVVRTFDIAEYHDRWDAIVNRYGNPQSVHFNLSREDESKLAEILAAARLERVQDNTISTVGSYVKGMVRERFHDYGYTRDDMVFTTPSDANTALRHSIPVYVLLPDNTSEQIKTTADIDKALYARQLFGMNDRDKRLLNFYKMGNTLNDLPFTHAELSAIFHIALDRGKENIEDSQQRKAIDGIIKTLDTILFSDDGRGVDEPPFDREIDDGMEQ